MLADSTDLKNALAEAKFFLAPGRIVRIYDALRNELPQLPRDADLAAMAVAAIQYGAMNSATIHIKVAV
jgi:hypothetical protein